MNTLELFPTLLYKTSITDHDQQAMIDRCNHYFKTYPDYRGGNLEGGAHGIHDFCGNLHKDPVFAPVVQIINKAIQEYWDALNYSDEWHPGINQMWANQYPKGGFASIHNHSPMWLTGVFYLVCEPGMGDIFFVDPNEALIGMQPLSNDRRYKKAQTDVPIKSGDIVIFPGWLNHGTHPNTTDGTRIVMPFEVLFKGADVYQKFATKLA